MALNDVRAWRRLFTAARAGLRGVRATPLVFFTSVVTMSAGLVLLGAYLLIVFNMRGTLERFGGAVRVVAFFPAGEDPSPDRAEAARTKLNALPGVQSIEFVPRDVALKRLRADLGEDFSVLDDLKENPLPAAFELNLAPSLATPAAVRELAAQARQVEGIEDTRFGEEWVSGYEKALASVEKVGLAIGVGLVLALGFMVGGTVRLAVHSCEDEIQIQRLVGASGFYVRLPFYIQGALQGAAGAIVSVLVLYAAFRFGVPLLGDSFQFLVGQQSWSFLSPAWIAALCGVGIGLGLGSAVLSLVNLEEAQ